MISGESLHGTAHGTEQKPHKGFVPQTISGTTVQLNQRGRLWWDSNNIKYWRLGGRAEQTPLDIQLSRKRKGDVLDEWQ
ncbi:hypothetical protein ElyMa_005913500 [Elysia marginata]|uniref:Uncharacterized protein n=1 Tax=Elysia marginata TaxID=1093978 RepID=A0AAV4G7F3_9GAST|nr:hypothetical protein ElyMa_005913500 [Elysia marginata]